MNPQQKMLVLALGLSGLFGVLFVGAGFVDAFELPAIVGTVSSFTAFLVAGVAIYCGHRSSEEIERKVSRIWNALTRLFKPSTAVPKGDYHAALDSAPSFALGLLRLVTRGNERKKLEGDLVEEYNEDIAPHSSRLYAYGWFLSHVLQVITKRIPKGIIALSGVVDLFRAAGRSRERDNDDDTDGAA